MRLWPGQVAELLDDKDEQHITARDRDAHSSGELARHQRTPNSQVRPLRVRHHALGTAQRTDSFRRRRSV